jgi:hypothetical protein
MNSNLRVMFSASCYDTQTVTHSFMERWFTLPWHPFQKIRTEQVSSVYRENDIIKAHPDHVTLVYRMVHRDEDAPTLKVKTVK